jgi:hypothetical protein
MKATDRQFINPDVKPKACMKGEAVYSGMDVAGNAPDESEERFVDVFTGLRGRLDMRHSRREVVLRRDRQRRCPSCTTDTARHTPHTPYATYTYTPHEEAGVCVHT